MPKASLSHSLLVSFIIASIVVTASFAAVRGQILLYLIPATISLLAIISLTKIKTPLAKETDFLAKLAGIQGLKSIQDALLTYIGEGIIVTDPEGRIITINKWAELILSTTAKEAVGKHLGDLVLIEEEKGFFITLDKLVRRLTAFHGRKTQAVLHVVQEDKTTSLALATTIIPIIIEGNKQAMLFVLPDTNREKESERVRTEFLSVIAHQLRSPLGSMRWGMEMLLSGDVGAISKETRETIDQMYESARWMITLVNDLLNVSRIEQGRVPNEPELIDYLEIVKTVIKESELDAKKKQVTITIEVKTDLIPMVMLDPIRFREVIQSLISNAIKYTYPQGKISIILANDNKNLQIMVADSGIGIPEKEQPKIFSKFFRATNAIETKAEGTGLGLFVVKSYIEAWEGKIWFESKEGKGTTFFVQIPIEGKMIIQKLPQDQKSKVTNQNDQPRTTTSI